MSVLVRLDRLCKSFERSGKVLDCISLDIDQGEFVSLIGPSGCGKTTLLRILSGLESFDAGSLAFLGPRTAGDTAFVFQEPALIPWLTVEENIRLPCELLKRIPESDRVEELLILVGLKHARSFLPRELSGGMKMRVSLARALMTHPKFLFLDEPFAALDEVTRLELEEELSAISRRFSMTTVLVTHSITEAVFLSNKIYLLSARTQMIHSAVSIEKENPRTDAFRGAQEFAQFVSKIRLRFGELGGNR